LKLIKCDKFELEKTQYLIGLIFFSVKREKKEKALSIKIKEVPVEKEKKNETNIFNLK
jgi:hypothetical protein